MERKFGTLKFENVSADEFQEKSSIGEMFQGKSDVPIVMPPQIIVDLARN